MGFVRICGLGFGSLWLWFLEGLVFRLWGLGFGILGLGKQLGFEGLGSGIGTRVGTVYGPDFGF